MNFRKSYLGFIIVLIYLVLVGYHYYAYYQGPKGWGITSHLLWLIVLLFPWSSFIQLDGLSVTISPILNAIILYFTVVGLQSLLRYIGKWF